jgi:hypothetical protein
MLYVSIKGVELSMFRVFKESEEMFLEQMLVQTLFNSQIENLLGYIKPLALPLDDIYSRPEMQCLGFRLSECDLAFKKNYC